MVIGYNQPHFKLLGNGLTWPREGVGVYHALLGSTERFLGREISLEYLGFIPFDESVLKAAVLQQPVLTPYPAAPASKTFPRLARHLRELPPTGGIDGSSKFFWRGLLG